MKTVFLIISLCVSIITCAQNSVLTDTIAKTSDWVIVGELWRNSRIRQVYIEYTKGSKETLVSIGTDSSVIKKGFMAHPYIHDSRENLNSDKNIPDGRNFYYSDTVFSFVLAYSEPTDIMWYNFVKCQKENGVWQVKYNVKIAGEMEDRFRHGFNVVFLNENTVYARGSRTKIIKGIDGAMDSAISDPLYFIATLNPDGSVSRFIKQENDIPATPLK